MYVSILPRLATGIVGAPPIHHGMYVSILPRLATGIVLRQIVKISHIVSILPRLATGIISRDSYHLICGFLFFPVLRRGSKTSFAVSFQ